MPRTITVTGHASAAAVPDVAVVRVSVVQRAPSLPQAVAQVDTASVLLVRVARGLTEASHVASSGLEVWPAQDAAGRPTGFEAAHRFRVTCPGLPTASAVVTGLVAEIGDRLRVEGVQLEVRDPGPARRSARDAAFADAQERARQLADLTGAELAEVLSVVEGGAVAEPGMPRAALSAAETVFEPGETSVACAVTVTWQLV